MEHNRSRRAAVSGAFVLLAAVGLFVAVVKFLAPFTPDDSYISYRYASNLAHGFGVTFNPGGQPVEGYSNFLWIVLCSIVVRLGLDVTWWAPRLGVAFGGATLLVMGRYLMRRRSVGQLSLVMPAVAASGPFALYAISGLETALYAFLVLCAVLATHRVAESRHGFLDHAALAVIGILAALCRPEGIALFPILMVLLLAARTPGEPLRGHAVSATLFLLSLLAYNAWRIHHFGDLLPTPFLSKGAGRNLVDAWRANWHAYFVTQNHYYAPFGCYYAALFFLAVAATPMKKRWLREYRLEAIALATAVFYAAVYVNFLDWMPGMRYFAPIIPVVAIAIRPEIGAAGGGPSVFHRAHALLALMVLMGGLFSVGVIANDARQTERSTWNSEVAIGKWLKANVPPSTVLAISDVGAAPYYAELRTIDINPRGLTDSWIAHHGWSNEHFFQEHPDIVVLVSFSTTTPTFYPEHMGLYGDPRFLREYRRIGVTRSDWLGDRSYWVFCTNRMQLTREQIDTFPPGLH